ncbi:MAG: SAM-dependent methyltransferase [Chloroflexi bacterium]|nr:MAG: SAM-dependent methyltransferase [Chloroflexota bacterium]
MNDYKQLVKESILDKKQFIRAVFTGQQRGQTVPWNKLIVRPVMLKESRHIQISHFDAKKDITKNYTEAEISEKLDEILTLPFKNIHVQTSSDKLQIQFTKKGKALIHRHKSHTKSKQLSLSHDRRKNLLLPGDKPDPFLETIGIMTKDGKIRANRQGKFKQINEFLKLVLESGELEKLDASPLHIIDCGCGNAYLTFAVFYYLKHILKLPTEMVGIDVNKPLLERRTAQTQELGWEGLSFQQSTIIDFQPTTLPHVVLALHACDTATDETLAQAIKWQSDMVFCAPCCHHHLQQQMTQKNNPDIFSPILRHSSLKERMGDILTDSFRSLILQIMGYRTDIVEFVSTEHTGKNLLIRAVKTGKPGNQRAVQEYKSLKQFWQLSPYLEQLLQAEIASLTA